MAQRTGGRRERRERRRLRRAARLGLVESTRPATNLAEVPEGGSPLAAHTTPLRLRGRPLELLRHTAGDLHSLSGKVERLAYALRNTVDSRERNVRIERLVRVGLVDRVPNRVQMAAGALDMFRFFIVPAADDYYRSHGFRFGFHALLRVLDDPASMVDPTGLASHEDAIIGHIMQVVHADPVYDLQLLMAVDDDPWRGIDELEAQIEAMLWGTHPRARSIAAIVEDPDYHARLLRLVRAFRRDPHRAPAMRRSNVVDNPAFSEIAETFGTITQTMRYFAALPEDPRGAALHLLTVHSFPLELARSARGLDIDLGVAS